MIKSTTYALGLVLIAVTVATDLPDTLSKLKSITTRKIVQYWHCDVATTTDQIAQLRNQLVQLDQQLVGDPDSVMLGGRSISRTEAVLRRDLIHQRYIDSVKTAAQNDLLSDLDLIDADIQWNATPSSPSDQIQPVNHRLDGLQARVERTEVKIDKVLNGLSQMWEMQKRSNFTASVPATPVTQGQIVVCP